MFKCTLIFQDKNQGKKYAEVETMTDAKYVLNRWSHQFGEIGVIKSMTIDDVDKGRRHAFNHEKYQFSMDIPGG